MKEKPNPIPYAPIGLTAAGTQHRRTRPNRIDVTCLILSLLQAAAAAAVISVGPVISGGPWPVRLIWIAGPTVPVFADLAAAVIAFIAATRVPHRRRYWHRIYLALLGTTLLLVMTGLGLAARWPVYVTDRPWAPPVNDHRLDVDIDAIPIAGFVVILANPVAWLTCVRANDRRRTLDALRQHRQTRPPAVPAGGQKDK